MSTDRGAPARTRLSRDARRRQLLEVAWRLVRGEGADALSLGRLAEQAGVTKPLVYDHFETRNGLLIALYREYDARQNRSMDAALEASEATLAAKAAVIASTYLDCVLQQGSEIPGVSAALAASSELEKVKREYEAGWMEKCRAALAPFAGAGGIRASGLWGMLGAAEALSRAAATGGLPPAEARDELARTIIAMVDERPGA